MGQLLKINNDLTQRRKDSQGKLRKTAFAVLGCLCAFA
jgi:hypothetical protein